MSAKKPTPSYLDSTAFEAALEQAEFEDSRGVTIPKTSMKFVLVWGSPEEAALYPHRTGFGIGIRPGLWVARFGKPWRRIL